MPHSKLLIVGNWKMNPTTLLAARKDFLAVKKAAGQYKHVETAIAAPFVYLPELAKSAASACALAAQNVSAEKEGAFTGEVSASMLAPLKIKYAIVGHSERRAMGENNTLINKKIKQLLAKNISPIVCVGETERDSGMWYLSAVKTQLEECLAAVPKASVPKIVIAYEPVWAISTTENRRDATPEDCVEMRIFIQKTLSDMFGARTAEAVRILYGGSVDEKNAVGFLVGGKADGLLPGHASLSPKKFEAIIKVANSVTR